MRDDNLQQKQEQDEQQYLEFAALKKALNKNMLEIIKKQPSKIPSNDKGLKIITELCETDKSKEAIEQIRKKLQSCNYDISKMFKDEQEFLEYVNRPIFCDVEIVCEADYEKFSQEARKKHAELIKTIFDSEE